MWERRQPESQASKRPRALRALRACWLAGAVLSATGCRRGIAQGAGGGPRTVSLGQSHTVEPAQRPADSARIAGLRVPPGFRVSVFARDLGHPRMMAVAPDGVVYVTRQREGDVLALPDRDGDGRADHVRTSAAGLPEVNGIALREDKLYLATPTRVWIAHRGADGSVASPRLLLAGMPEGGRHPNRTLAFGPDGWLYVSVGSSCNACNERDPLYATLLRVRADGSGREVFARGLRNTIGFDWQPGSGVLYGMDHGSDERGDEVPREELNRLERGGDYGWPYCFGAAQTDLRSVEELGPTNRACRATRPAVLGYTAHAAPMGFLFYRGTQFPSEYRGDAFVAFRGSWNRRPPSGYEVVRLRFRAGQPVAFEPFLTGFLTEEGRARFGRPVGLALAPDGALLVADDEGGVIYRVSYVGAAGAAATGSAR